MLDVSDAKIVVEFGEYIESSKARSAYYSLIGAAAVLQNYQCMPTVKGKVRDFRFYDSAEEQPFSFIINRESLLFYFRLPSVRSGKFDLARLNNDISEVKVNNRGEWTVRINDVQEALTLLNIVFPDYSLSLDRYPRKS